MKIIVHELMGRNAPFHQKGAAALVLFDALGGLASEMVYQTAANALEMPDAAFPEFAGKVGVGIHARTELDAHSTNPVPKC